MTSTEPEPTPETFASSETTPDPAPTTEGDPTSEPKLRYAHPVVALKSEVWEAEPVSVSNAGAAYRVADLIAEGFKPDRDRFHDPDYRPMLRLMVAKVIEVEGPIFEDCLVSRIVASHNFGRTGGHIRSAIVNVIDERILRSTEAERDVRRNIYWPEGSNLESFPTFRTAPRELRDHADIPLAELANLARRFVDDGLDDEATIRRMSEVFELQKLRAPTRARFESAVRHCTRKLIVEITPNNFCEVSAIIDIATLPSCRPL